MGAPRLTLGGPGREAQADRQFDGKDLDGRKLGRKFVRELCGNGHDAAAWMPREWFVLAQRAGAWELRLRPGTDAIGLLRAGDERRQTQVVRPGETQRLRDGDRLIFAMPEEEGGGLFGYVDVRLDERLDERRRKRERPQVAAAPGPAKRPRTDCCTCAKQHAGACHCGSTGHCAWCRRCDHCRKAESPAAPGDCPRGGGAWGAGGPAFPARAPRAECLPKTAETLRCEVCDKKYPENPPNLPLVRMLEVTLPPLGCLGPLACLLRQAMCCARRRWRNTSGHSTARISAGGRGSALLPTEGSREAPTRIATSTDAPWGCGTRPPQCARTIR